MIKIVVQKNMDGAYYALAYDGEDILFKTKLFDTESEARKEAVERLVDSDLCLNGAARRLEKEAIELVKILARIKEGDNSRTEAEELNQALVKFIAHASDEMRSLL